MIEILPCSQEVRYRGLLFHYNKIKPYVKGFVDKEFLDDFVVFRKFNRVSGDIEYKYAWDSLIYQLSTSSILSNILDDILSGEEEE